MTKKKEITFKLDETKFLYLFLAVAVVLVLAQVFMVFGKGTSFSPSSGKGVRLGSDASVNEIITAFLPGDEDNVRGYQWKGEDVTLRNYAETNGKQLREMEREISLDDLTPDQRELYDEITNNIYSPCCGSPPGKCGCVHAVAQRGLAKFLLKEGWSEDEVLEEIFLWKRYWWPKHYAGVAMYLSQQGQSVFDYDPKTLMGPEFSTVNAGRKIGAELGMKLY